MGATSRAKSTSMLADPARGIDAGMNRTLVAVFFIALFVVVVGSTVYGWRQWGRTVVARPVYRIAPENLRITPTPDWIRTDVRSEVIRDGALQDLTIFDKDVTIRVYQAFELHPWVAKVKRVSKHPPARLDVELEYRRPVAWVEVPRGVLPGNEGGVIPVDESGVVLPSRDFTQENVAEYLRIAIPDISPCGLAGTAWGDPRVTDAARIAAVLEPVWREAKLYRVRQSTDPEWVRHDTHPIYEIETQGRRRILWGRPPSEEVTGDPSPPVKLSRLRQLVEAVGELDRAPESVWDLRRTDVLQSTRIRHSGPVQASHQTFWR